MPLDQVTICLVGYGSIGALHYEIYQQFLDVRVDVVDADAQKRAQLAEKGIRCYATIQEALKNTYQLIDICLPTTEHEVTVRRALRASQALVLCEKPLTQSLATSKKLLRLKNAEDRLYCAFVERFHEPFAMMKSWIKQNPGPYKMSFIRRTKQPPAHHWAVSQPEYGGVLLDLAIHDIDLANWLAQSEPIEVTRYTVDELSEKIRIQFENSEVTIEASWSLPESHPYGISNQVKVQNQQGNFISYDSEAETVITNQETRVVKPRFMLAYQKELQQAVDLACKRPVKSNFPDTTSIIRAMTTYDVIQKEAKV